MSVLKIPAEDALKLYEEQPAEPVNGVRLIDVKFYQEWKWGIRYEVIVQDALTEKYYSAVVSEQIRHYNLDWHELAEVEFEEVERVQVMTYEYKRPQDVER